MKGLRVALIAVALLALPFAAGFAQGSRAPRAPVRSGVRPTDAVSDCKDQQAAALARAAAEGRDAPYGLDKKCDDPVPPPPPNQPPVASFAFGCSGLACGFTSTSGDPDGTVASYAWTFGDGGTSAVQNPSHTYAAPGSYPVTLTVTDNLSASSSTSQAATVSAPPPPGDPGLNRAIGLVWEDIDGNGLRDPFAGEMGLAGWTVQLLDANGQVLSSKVSDPDGNFAFDALGIGTFSVCIVNPGGYTQTVPQGGTGCGGLGYTFTFLNNIGTWAINDFGEMANP